MIRMVEWLLGRTEIPSTRRDEVVTHAEQDRRTAETDTLDQRRAEAEQHRNEARAARQRAESAGSRFRAELESNHFGERLRYALHQEGWKPR